MDRTPDRKMGKHNDKAFTIQAYKSVTMLDYKSVTIQADKSVTMLNRFVLRLLLILYLWEDH